MGPLVTAAHALQPRWGLVPHLQWSVLVQACVLGHGSTCKSAESSILHYVGTGRLHGLLTGARVSTADSTASNSSEQWCYSRLAGISGVRPSLTLGRVLRDDLTDLCACKSQCTGAGADVADLGLKPDV